MRRVIGRAFRKSLKPSDLSMMYLSVIPISNDASYAAAAPSELLWR